MANNGRQVMLPLLNRPIPLIADVWAKPELGTGCVKITPAHDPNDYDVWQRHLEIGAVNILNPDGTLNENAGPYRDQDVMEARDNVVADLEKLGLMEKIEDRQIEIAHSDRSKTPIEPYLTDQWFVKMDELAQSAIDAVTDGRVKIVPDRYAKGYLDWLGEKRDWPIGRQLWWGHQIPVWKVTLPIPNSSASDSNLAIRRNRFFNALDNFAITFGIKDEIARVQVEESQVGYYVCARTEDAVRELDHFYSRHHRARNVNSIGNDVINAPPLSSNDPKYQADIELSKSIGYMNEQEQDVLDTWFSSALWPHSTLGWPEKTPELEYYYPTSVLITNRDIITLWVARMVLTGLQNVGKVPFHEVFIHPKILDGYGEGMSKSKGNGVDPIDVMDKFGADALRFGLAYLTTETQDIRLPVEFECPSCGKMIEQTRENRVLPRIKCGHCAKPFSTQWAEKPEDKALPRGAVVNDRFELARNFCNKLWNASRFTLMNLEGYTPGIVRDEALRLEDKWILSRLTTVTKQVTDALAEYRYADAARALYDFAWDEFCSFYVEMVKGRLQDETQRAAAQRVLAHTLDTLLRLLHPMIPFLTEDVWQRLSQVAPQRGIDEPGPAAESIMIAPWPEFDSKRQNAEIEAQFAQFQQVLRAIRDIRMHHNVPPKKHIEFTMRFYKPNTDQFLWKMQAYFISMAKAGCKKSGSRWEPSPTHVNVKLPGMDVFVDLAELIDVEAEIERKKQEVEKLAGFISAKEKKLENKNFIDRAPPEVVQKERDSLADLQAQYDAAGKVLKGLSKVE
jgi:valyl-tRNA synthetase